MERYRASHDDRYSNAGDSPHFRHPLPPPPRPDDLNHPHNRRSNPPPNLQHPGDGADFNSSPPRLPPWIRGAGDLGGGPRSSNYQVPLTGQKRPYSNHSGSPEHVEGLSFAKLFVGSVPRTASEADIRPLFEEHGRVLEVALIKDKRTGQQQGCCFIKYATSDEADRAIRALHNLRSLPGGLGPIQVRYADGERERIGTVEFKLFVGSLNKQATEKEVEQIFSQYGRVEDVYLMRDEMKQSRGCGFVKFSSREMALAAINALSEKYVMRGCEQPLTVRFADPKRPKPGESRSGPAFGGPGVGPQFQPSGARQMTNISEPIQGQIPPKSWRPRSPQNLGPFSDSGKSGFGSQFPRSGDVPVAPTAVDGSFGGGPTGSAHSSLPGLPVSSSSMNFIPAMSQMPSIAHQLSPLQQRSHPSPQQFPTALQLQLSPSDIRTQTLSEQLPQPGQRQMPYSAVQATFGQTFLSQQLPGVNEQIPCSQPQIQQNSSSTAAQTSSNSNFLPHVISTLANQQVPPQQMLFQPVSQQPTPQMLTQQKLSLEATISHLQQQLGFVQSLTVQQGSQAAKQETGGGTHAILSVTDGSAATSATSVIPEMIQGVAPLKCNWTEHTSPDGFKYYYNSTTGESKWEMPEEFALFEKQQSQPQNSSVQQPQNQPQGFSTQKIHHNPQGQNQSQFQTRSHSQLRQPHQFPQASQSMTAPRVANQHSIQDLAYTTQLPTVPSSTYDPTRFQQGQPATQEWMWKNKPAGA